MELTAVQRLQCIERCIYIFQYNIIYCEAKQIYFTLIYSSIDCNTVQLNHHFTRNAILHKTNASMYLSIILGVLCLQEHDKRQISLQLILILFETHSLCPFIHNCLQLLASVQPRLVNLWKTSELVLIKCNSF